MRGWYVQPPDIAADTVLINLILPRPVTLAVHLKLRGDISDNHGLELFPLGCQPTSMEVSRVCTSRCKEMLTFT